MTNKEFYLDKSLAIALENACATFHRVVHGKNCGRKNCDDCEFSTVERVEKWLNAEHEKPEPEPPLLKNGDNLKPGDWIMVRNDSGLAWQKRCFMCCRYGYFITVSRGHSICTMGGYEAWKQARLPMEDE